tara:strand:+ start:165 stop:629 length:465 start_codon:yes stop_codon:yes gene_type:complete
MIEKTKRSERIKANLSLDKLSSGLNIEVNTLGLKVSEFIHHIFEERVKSEPLNWCFANIKRVKIFLQIFHANQSNKEIYKEEIAKNLTEYSYKTIAKIIDDGIAKKYYILLPPDTVEISRDSKVKNIRPSEKLITDFLNLCIEIIAHIDKNKPI